MSEQKDRPDREKIARELCPDKAGWDANIRDVYVTMKSIGDKPTKS